MWPDQAPALNTRCCGGTGPPLPLATRCAMDYTTVITTLSTVARCFERRKCGGRSGSTDAAARTSRSEVVRRDAPEWCATARHSSPQGVVLPATEPETPATIPIAHAAAPLMSVTLRRLPCGTKEGTTCELPVDNLAAIHSPGRRRVSADRRSSPRRPARDRAGGPTARRAGGPALASGDAPTAAGAARPGRSGPAVRRRPPPRPGPSTVGAGEHDRQRRRGRRARRGLGRPRHRSRQGGVRRPARAARCDPGGGRHRARRALRTAQDPARPATAARGPRAAGHAADRGGERAPRPRPDQRARSSTRPPAPWW